jgi:hypothetical protein
VIDQVNLVQFQIKVYLNVHLETGISIDSRSVKVFTLSLIEAITQDRSVFTFYNSGNVSRVHHFSADLALP